MFVVTVVILITAKRKLTETAISTSVETYLLLRSSTQSEMHKPSPLSFFAFDLYFAKWKVISAFASAFRCFSKVFLA